MQDGVMEEEKEDVHDYLNSSKSISTTISAFERAQGDLTGSQGHLTQSQMLRLYSNRIEKSANVTIK